MSKDRRNDGRRRTRREQAKHARRIRRRKRAWQVTDDGAGPRDIDHPRRHHR